MSLRIRCLDSQALDLLSSPKAPSLFLQRVLSLQYDPESTEVTSWQNMDTSRVEDLRAVAARSLIEDEAIAVWWPDLSFVGDSSSTRGLQGEIHLKPVTYPSSQLGHFQLSVTSMFLCDPSTTLILHSVHCSVISATCCRFQPIRKCQSPSVPNSRGNWHNPRARTARNEVLRAH